MHIARLARGAGSIVAGGVLAGLVGGMALGSFATGGNRAGGPDPLIFAEQVGNPHAAYAEDGAGSTDAGGSTTEVRCKGCGPGIIERLSRQYGFGYDDRAVQARLDYSPAPPLTAAALEADAAAGRPAIPAAAATSPTTSAAGPRPMVQPVTPRDDQPIPSTELAG